MNRKNNQIPSTNYQIIINTQTPINKLRPFWFGYLDIGAWNLFGIWDLVIGIFK
jgi:hypothetical protein